MYIQKTNHLLKILLKIYHQILISKNNYSSFVIHIHANMQIMSNNLN